MTKVLERQDKSTKKRKLSSGGQQNIYNYHDSTDLFDFRIIRINRTLINDPPIREMLSGQMLERN